MKILHIVPTYFPAFKHGGPIISIHSLNKWLVKKGEAVTVFTTNINGQEVLKVPLAELVNLDGVRVFYFPYSFPRAWEYSRLMHKAIAEEIADFEIVHIDAVFRASTFLGSFYAKKYNKPYIISPRGALMKEPLAKKGPFKKRLYLNLIEKRILGGAAAIHFTSQAEKEEYLAAGLPTRKSFVISNSFETERPSEKPTPGIFRKKFDISDRAKVILFLSRLNWKKGLDTLVPAFRKVLQKEPQAVLVLTGNDDGNYKQEIESMIDNCKLKIGRDVIFTGLLLGQDKISAFLDSQLFVLPSYSENFGMAVVEAMAAGLPVVLTKGVGISNEIAEAGAGLVVEKDITQVSEAILKILRDKNLAQKMGQVGRELVGNKFSPEPIANQWIKAYNQLI